MSWLLVALIPGFLMLAAVGLGRLETWLADEPAAAIDAPQPAPAALPRRTEHLALPVGFNLDSERLPTRYYEPQTINPGFQASRHADRV